MKKQHLLITMGAAIILCFTSCVQEHSCECDFTDLNGDMQTENYTVDGDDSEASSYCTTREDELDDIYADADCALQ